MRDPVIDKLIKIYQRFSREELEPPSNMCWRLSKKDASGLFQYVSTTEACRGVWGEVTSIGDLTYLFGLRIVSVAGERTVLRKGRMTNKERMNWRLV